MIVLDSDVVSACIGRRKRHVPCNGLGFTFYGSGFGGFCLGLRFADMGAWDKDFGITATLFERHSANSY